MTKEEIDNLIKLEGKVRGVVFQTDAEYVKEKVGEEGLRKLEEKVKELNLPLNYRRAKAMEWYPIGLRAISLLLIREVFGWDEKEIREMGKTAPKVSFIVKLFFKLFLSIRKLTKEVPKFWREHYTIGELEVVELNEEKKYMILHLKNFRVHPLLCSYLEGYFETVLALTRETRRASVAERRCLFKEEVDFHEYYAEWE
jgi:hypothetical protein